MLGHFPQSIYQDIRAPAYKNPAIANFGFDATDL